MSQLVRLEGKHTAQTAHCAMQAATAAPAVIASDKRVQKRKLIVGLLQPVLNRK